MTCFHPTMVRIKHDIFHIGEGNQHLFPSHNGSDQTEPFDIDALWRIVVSIPQWFGSNEIEQDIAYLMLAFPSHNGSDQTLRCQTKRGKLKQFPSHNGSDQTKTIFMIIFKKFISFHPTMVRIKRKEGVIGRITYGMFPSHNGSDQTTYTLILMRSPSEVSIPQWFGSNQRLH